MVPDPVLPNLHYLDVEHHVSDCYRYVDGDVEYGCEFQVVRDADWSQVLHPLQEQADISAEATGPDAQGHGLNWFVSSEGLSPFRLELFVNASDAGDVVIHLAVRYEYSEWNADADAGLVSARTGALAEAARRGCWQAVLCSLSGLRKWGPSPGAEMLGLGIEACANSLGSPDVWQQAALPAEDIERRFPQSMLNT